MVSFKQTKTKMVYPWFLFIHGGAKLRSPICPLIIVSRVSSLLREQKGVIDLKKEKMKMVPGFHFLPSDCELIIHYLLRKVRGEEILWDGILDFELYEEKAP
jgi:hypothetical protein